MMVQIKPAGENSIIVYFASEINPKIPALIRKNCQLINNNHSDLIVDLTPSFTSILINYRNIKHDDFVKLISKTLVDKLENNFQVGNKITIPVLYHEALGFDLKKLALEKKLDIAELIAIHSQKEYLVYAIGFSPAFAYLAKVDHKIAAARLATPRLKIPAGSVGIADTQTAVYPVASAGGWRIIGRTPLDLSLNKPSNLKKFSIGDKVKFKPINEDEYFRLGGHEF